MLHLVSVYPLLICACSYLVHSFYLSILLFPNLFIVTVRIYWRRNFIVIRSKLKKKIVFLRLINLIICLYWYYILYSLSPLNLLSLPYKFLQDRKAKLRLFYLRIFELKEWWYPNFKLHASYNYYYYLSQ